MHDNSYRLFTHSKLKLKTQLVCFVLRMLFSINIASYLTFKFQRKRTDDEFEDNAVISFKS